MQCPQAHLRPKISHAVSGDTCLDCCVTIAGLVQWCVTVLLCLIHCVCHIDAVTSTMFWVQEPFMRVAINENVLESLVWSGWLWHMPPPTHTGESSVVLHWCMTWWHSSGFHVWDGQDSLEGFCQQRPLGQFVGLRWRPKCGKWRMVKNNAVNETESSNDEENHLACTAEMIINH